MSLSLGPRLPQRGFVFRAVTECPIQVWGGRGSLLTSLLPHNKGSECGPLLGKGKVPASLTGAAPPQLVMGMPGAAGRC